MKLGAGDLVERMELPASSTRVLGDIRWGRFDDLFTPAFWVSRIWIDGTTARDTIPNYKLGTSLEEEVVACMLGGYGMSAETGLAAFKRLKDRQLIRASVTDTDLYTALIEPLNVAGKTVRYRFPRQKASFIAAALNRLGVEKAPADELEFRDWLITFKGIGPKTASWITRNWLESDRVAILDVHLHRAGLLIGLFEPDETIAKHYQQMEVKLVKFASAIGIRLSELDDLVWRYMKNLNLHAIGLVGSGHAGTAGK
jgi:N-glycosylase/DNA lyase